MTNLHAVEGVLLTQKPTYASIPTSMRSLRAFVPYLLIPTTDGKSKWRKQAINPKTCKAVDWNNPADFVTMDQALELLWSHPNFHGIGMCFKGKPMINGRYLVGIDLDGVYEENSQIQNLILLIFLFNNVRNFLGLLMFLHWLHIELKRHCS